jgi:hypothetical protein
MVLAIFCSATAAGYANDFQLRVRAPNLFKHLKPVEVRKVHVEQHEIDIGFGEALERISPRCGYDCVEPAPVKLLI